MKQLTKNENIKYGFICASKRYMNEHIDVHRHDFFELELYLNAGGSHILDGVEHTLKRGLLFFMTPMNFHDCDIQNAEFYNVMFTGNLCDPELLVPLTNRAPLALNLNEETTSFFAIILEELTKHPNDLTFSAALLNAILAKLVADIAPVKLLDERSVIKELELYILNNFREEITLNDVAKQANLSPNYLSHLFKKETGQNFKTYLNTLRYDYAKKLLAFTDMTVQEICNECGFHDYPNFIRRFRQHTDLYPSAYREKFHK